jgi:DNA-binding CsgD family transcriptional regulator
VVARLTTSEQELRTIAGIVSERRSDVPAEGMPLSLLRDLKELVPCDFLLCQGYDTTHQQYWFTQQIPEDDDESEPDQDFLRLFWEVFWGCKVCSYPDHSQDLRSVVKVYDFYSVRQWRSAAMYRDIMLPQGLGNHIQLCLSEPPGSGNAPGRTVRLFFLRELGLDFSERDRALLMLLRPHLQQAFYDAELRRTPVPELTPRQWDLLHLMAGGRTNIQIARQLGLSEGTVRTHLENIYGRLQVSNRTAAVIRAFPDRVA